MTDDVPHKMKNIHLAIIPDGNRRWAKKHKKPVWYGHFKGAKKMEEFLDWCLEHPEIKMVSIYALSTENLKRDKKELKKLWDIYKKEFNKLLNSKKVKNNEIRVNIVGDMNAWRNDVRKLALTLMKVTENYTRYILNILLAYGSHFEILNAIKKIVGRSIKHNPLLKESFSKFLMVNRPVDLIIRTGGQYRLSNFLLFQAAYAEIYFSDTLWPDFSKKEFEKILRWFQKQKRKFGI